MLDDTVQPFFAIQWTQNHENVFLTLQQKLTLHKELVKNEPLVYTLECSDSSLCDSNLYDTICIQQFCKSTVKPLKGLEIIISKMEKGEYWPRLTYTDVKYHFIQNDWSKWTEWSDEMESDNLPKKAALPEEYCSLVTLPDGRTVHVPFFNVLGENSNCVLKITTNDCRDIPVDTIPSLPSLLSQEFKPTVVFFWKETLTVPQRLHTFTAFWNSTNFEERQAILKELTTLMVSVNNNLAQDIKGGNQVIRDIDINRYTERYVSCPSCWINQFQDLTLENKVLILSELFQNTSDYEKVVICSTFI